METLITNGLIIFSKTTFNPFMTEAVTISAQFYISYRNQSLDLQYSAMAGFYLKCKLIWNNLNEKDKLGGTSKLPQNILDLKVFFVTVRVKMKKTIHFVPMTLFTSVFSCVLRNCFSIMESIEIKGSMDMK